MRGVGGSELASTASPPPPPPHLLLCIVYPSFLLWLSAEPFFHPYLTGQSPCLRLSDNVK